MFGLLRYFFKDLAIDLGTANTLIACDDRIVLNEPSIIAIDRNSGRLIAVGAEAMQMHEKTHQNIRTVRPLRDGVIADFKEAEMMMQAMIHQLHKKKKPFIPSFFNRIIVCIPSGTTDVEKRAVRDAAANTGAREVYMIYEPIAAAIGIGMNIAEPVGCMVVDIGGGTTEIAVIALAGIACDQSIKVAGNAFNQDILDYMRKNHNVLVGERTAEQIKITVGSACTELDEEVPPYDVYAKDLITGIPRTVTVHYREIAQALEESMVKIDNAVLKALEIAPPELAADIYKHGIYLTGGGALLRGLHTRLHKLTNLPIHVAKEPLQAVVRGTGIALKNIDTYRSVLMV